MATLTITSNFKEVLGQVADQIGLIVNPQFLLRPAAQEAISLIHPRIHIRGEASDGNQIGEYSKGYLAIRSGIFENSDRFKKGANKGKIKNAGKFTEATIRLNKKTGIFSGEDKVGTARPQFHRGTDKKVIISLTRQLENDYAVVPIENGYGVGFNNSHNFDKSQNVERIYKKNIFNLTVDEQAKIQTLIENLLSEGLRALSSI